MRRALVYVHNKRAGTLTQNDDGTYAFDYDAAYVGPAVSLTMPVSARSMTFPAFPPFFEGLLPEGDHLESLLRQAKLDRNDFFGQLLCVGEDMVGAVTVLPLP